MNRREFIGLLAAPALSGISIAASDIVFATDIRSAASIPRRVTLLIFRYTFLRFDLNSHLGTKLRRLETRNGSRPSYRVEEGQHVTIDVRNDSDAPDEASELVGYFNVQCG